MYELNGNLTFNRSRKRAVQIDPGSMIIHLWNISGIENNYPDVNGGYVGWVTSSRSAMEWLEGRVPDDLIQRSLI